MLERSRPVRWFDFLWLAPVFGISYSQYALFYHTQNQYFFYGLARAGFGQLQSDWFARTPDPWPVFTFLVEFTYRYLDQRFFYLYFIVLLGVYAFSLLGIVSVLFHIDRSRLKYLVFVVLFIALHSPVFGYLSRMVLGLPMASSPHHFNVGRILLLEGVGEKRILGDMLNPGTFGVFLLLSIFLFLRGKPFLAITASTLAAMFQPSYVLSAGILTLAYMTIVARRREGLRRSVGLGLYALGLILPLVAYSYVAFRPTDPGIWKKSQDILWRIAYYPPSDPALWLGATVYMKMGLVLVAGYLVRRTQLFWILLLSFLAATGLTVVQILTDSNSLAALLPWRISALLVPLATVILLGYGVSQLVDQFEPNLRAGRSVLVALSSVSVVALVIGGAIETKWRFDLTSEAKMPGVLRFVRETKAPGQTYLIPPNWRTFRLFTGAPAFAERSVIPYNDVGVMEWYKRVRLAEAFYGAVEADREDDYRYQRPNRRTAGALQASSASTPTQPPREERCRMLKELSATHGVTHVILKGEDLDGCGGWRLVLDDGAYRLYAVTS